MNDRPKATIVSDKMPEAARKAVINNITSTPGLSWVLINLQPDIPVVIPSKGLTQEKWLNAMVAMRDQAFSEEHT